VLSASVFFATLRYASAPIASHGYCHHWVCLTHVWTVLKRLNISSNFFSRVATPF